jgi:heat shock protein HtpX
VGYFDIITMVAVVIAFNVIQWLFAPYLIGAMYRVREMKPEENPNLHATVENLSKKSHVNTPKLMLAQIPLPNAFAYGSPVSGNRIAVTQGLLTTLNDGEVEAVLGHEIGHLRHRDVQVMMVVSFLPAVFYMVGYSLMWSGMLGNGRKGDSGNAAAFGILFMVFSQVLTLFTLHVSRLREYYADRHSVSVVDEGADKLSTGLAKIVNAAARTPKPKQQAQAPTQNAFKALFIADPDRAKEDAAELYAWRNGDSQRLVDEQLNKKITFGDKLIEALSTHPNITKRLRALQELKKNPKS